MEGYSFDALYVEIALREDVDVGASREEALVRAPHQDRLDGVVAAGVLDRRVELVEERAVVGVRRWPVEHDVPDRILLQKTHGHGKAPQRKSS